MADNTIEIVVKADGRQALANLERLRQVFIETENRASTSTSKMRGELEQLGRTADRVLKRELTSALNIVGVSTGLFAGGLVAGLVGAGKALADFGRSGLQLHYLAEELNVSAQSLTRWRLAGQAAGLSSDQAANDVETAMKKLQDLGRRGFHSELYQELAASTADLTGRSLAMALAEQVRSGGPEQGFRFLLQKLQQYTKEGDSWGVSTIERLIGLSRGWGRALENADKFGKVTVVSAEDAAKFQIQLTLLGHELDSLKTEVGNELLPTFTELARTLREWLQTTEGKKFQQDLIDLAGELKKLDWQQIGKDVGTTVRVISAIFTEGKAVIEAFISTVTLGFYNFGRMKEYRDTFNQRKLREERRAGLHGEAARQMVERWHRHDAPITRRLPGQGGGMADELGAGSIGGGGPQSPFPRRRRASSVYKFADSGGGDEDFSSVNKRRDTTDNLTDQMRDVTDEVRRLNDLLRGGGDVATTPGGGAGGMGPTGGRGGGGGGGGGGGRQRDGTTNPNNPQNPPNTTSSPQTNPPPSTGQDPTQLFAQPSGAAGIQGAPGGPSGRSLTPAERKAASQVPGGGTADTPLPGGSGSSAIYQKLLAAYQNSSVVGTIPADGARYGFKTGSAEEWARFAMIIAASESDYNPKTAVNNAKEQSFGIFQYNHPQVPGGNAFDVDASVKAFVRDSESSMKTHGNLGPGSILYRRFSTIQNTPPAHRHRQAEEAIKKAQREPKQPGQPQPGQPPQLGPNALPPPGTVPPGSRTTAGIQPAPGAPPVPGQPPPGDPGQQSAAGLVHPVQGGAVLSVFGDPRPGGPTGRHQGIDIAAKSGTFIGATSDQTIRDVGWIGGNYGWGVKTVDSQGREHVYAHMLHDPRITHNLKIGDALKPGQQVGQVGNSGNAKNTPSHLHYEVRPKVGAYAGSHDPRKYLPPFPGEKGYQSTASRGPAPPSTTASAEPQPSSIPPILRSRQGVPPREVEAGQQGWPRTLPKTISNRRADDAASDRKQIDSSLVAQMSQQVMSGRAAIDIDVGAAVARANGNADKDLFNKIRSKSAPQMPNTVTNGDGDRNSGSDEGNED